MTRARNTLAKARKGENRPRMNADGADFYGFVLQRNIFCHGRDFLAEVKEFEPTALVVGVFCG